MCIMLRLFTISAVLWLVAGDALAFDDRCVRKRNEFRLYEVSYSNTRSMTDLKYMYELAVGMEEIAMEHYRNAELAEAMLSNFQAKLHEIDFRLCAKHLLESQLVVADVYLDLGNIEIPKKIYRKIVVSYPGSAWASYVKKAEFGLEDVREAEEKLSNRAVTK